MRNAVMYSMLFQRLPIDITNVQDESIDKILSSLPSSNPLAVSVLNLAFSFLTAQA
jgi:hypothetical protein